MNFSFPIKSKEWLLFASMFSVVCLINVNFSILRSMRNALVVGDVGGTSAFIPYFELFGTFPASVLLTWGLSRFMRAFSFRFIFSATMLFFLFFFVLFAFWIYPQREQVHLFLEQRLGLFLGFSHFKVVFTHWPDMLFYVMAELWKVALLSVLFWGFVNQNLSLEEAKRFYPPLMLGSSIGAILAGPITVFCSSHLSWKILPLAAERWQHSLSLLTFFLLLSGALTLLLFSALSKNLNGRKITPSSASFSQKLLSLSSSLRYLMRSPYLASLLCIVVAEYISYTLGELIFLEMLKNLFPNPSDYCQYMGNLTLWTGVVTAISALFFTPYVLQTYRWRYAALLTPILMIGMTFAFFFVLSCGKLGFSLGGIAPLSLAVIFGSFHFCIGRSVKYTLFDASKELAFIPLNQEAQVKGKLIIDGIGSRFGRGASSLLSIALFTLLGGPGESIFFAGILALSFAFLSLPLANFLGHEFEKISSAETEN